MGLKLIFLIVTRAVSLLGLSRREWWQKDAEILMLRHQLAVAERERPRAHSRLTWPDRAWLALLAGTVPAERLAAMRLIVTPGTILRWQRDIVRRRWARVSRRGRSGRPAAHRKVRSAVLRLARENESRGYRRIHGELAGPGITVAPSTVWQILKSAGTGRAPRRDGPGWAEFLRVPGAGDPGAGLLHRRPAQRHEGLRPCRHRARHPPHPAPRSLWRAITRIMALSWCFLCRLGCSSVLVNQAMDDLPALDPGGHIDRLAGFVQRRSLLPRLVRPMLVVVPRVFGQSPPEVLFAVDQQVVQALAP